MVTTTPTSFSITSEVRGLATRKAKADGISLASAVRLLLAGYAAGRIAIVAVPVSDAVMVENVEEVPMGASTRKLAGRAIAAVRKHGRR